MSNEVAQFVTKDPYELALVQVWKLIMIHNRVSLSGIGREDLKDIASNLRQEYSLDEINSAVSEIKLGINSSTTLDTFLEKCAALRRANERIESTQKIFKINSRDKRLSAGKFDELKQMLVNTIKPLPYNKDYRVMTSKYSGADDNGKSEAEMDLHELREHLNKKRNELHGDLASLGTIRAFQDVKDPELRRLYQKAWSDKGVTREEKDQMLTLAQTSGEKIVGI